MRTRRSMSPPEMWITTPPYHGWFSARELGLSSGTLLLGTVVGLDVGLARDPIRFEAYRGMVMPFLLDFPWVPLVLRVKDSRAANVHIVRAAGDFGFAGVVGDDEPLQEALRQDLCTLPRPRTIGVFLRACFSDADPAVRDEALGLLVAGLEESAEAGLPVPEAAGGSRRLRRDGLLSPGKLRRSGQLLHVVLGAQRDYSLTLLELAEACGYSSGSALNRALRRRFHAGVRVIRSQLGWQPWLFRALCPDRRAPGEGTHLLTSDAEDPARVA
jgi:hypothetical protein